MVRQVLDECRCHEDTVTLRVPRRACPAVRYRGAARTVAAYATA